MYLSVTTFRLVTPGVLLLIQESFHWTPRVWSLSIYTPHKSEVCQYVLAGQSSPIT